MKILGVQPNGILNSVGKPSLEVTVKTKNGIFSSSIPHGTSVGKYEVPLKSVSESIAEIKKMKIKEINSFDEIIEFEKSIEQLKIISLPLIYSLIKAFAAEGNKEPYELFGMMEKPALLFKIVGGGLHAGGPEFKEFLISPQSNSLIKNLKIAYSIHREFGELLKLKGKDM